MTIDESIKNLIKSYLDSNFKPAKIYSMLNGTVPKTTIYRWVKRLLNGDILSKKSPGRKRTVTNKTLIAKIRRNYKKNQKKKTVKKLAEESKCSRSTIARIIRNEVKFKPYKKIICPKLKDHHIDQRYSFAIWIRKNYNRDRCRTILFSDEKIFNANGQINRQNDRVYAESREEANRLQGLHKKDKYPFSVMVWLGMTWNGFTRLVVLPPKTSFDSDFYIKYVIPVIEKDGKELIGDDFTFQQDGASSHTSIDTIDELEMRDISYIPPIKWPANSPDLNPLDYSVWNEIENRLKSKSFSNRPELIKKIVESINEIPLKFIRDSIESFRSRIYNIEKNKGNLIINKYR